MIKKTSEGNQPIDERIENMFAIEENKTINDIEEDEGIENETTNDEDTTIEATTATNTTYTENTTTTLVLDSSDGDINQWKEER